MRRQILITTLTLCAFCIRVQAQDTLPKFQVLNVKGRIFVAFYNPFTSAAQVNIERSFDSVRNFTTIHAESEPKTGVVSFWDAKAPTPHMYYRIFIQQLQGGYSFTRADTPLIFVPPQPVLNIGDVTPSATPSYLLTPAPAVKRKPEWEPSTHIFTDDYGNVKVALPPLIGKKYSVKFYDDQQHFLFELPDVRESPLTIDKSNFLHAGWFNFELYVNGVVQEKNKFLLSRDN
jgi:hypothetical protein